MTSLITLIPAYKADYLAELFLGLRSQSFKDFRVVLSDDSPGGTVTALIRSGALESLIAPLDLLVVQGPRQGALKNLCHLIDGWAAQAPLVHLLMDDDIVYPDFYRSHALAHSRGAPGASVSQRWLTASDGRPGAMLPLPAFFDDLPERLVYLDAAALFATTAAHCQNWLGELSNMVLSQEAVRRLRSSSMNGLSYYGLGDIGALLDVSCQTPIVFIRDHLGGFRSHPQQTTHNRASFPLKCGYLAWVALALAGWRGGHLSTEQAQASLAISVGQCMNQFASDPTLSEFFGIAIANARNLSSFDQHFAAWWAHILSTHSEAQAEAPKVLDLQAA
ncbi:MAG: glycosyltransferase family A protein [Burkholderiales bacterium]